MKYIIPILLIATATLADQYIVIFIDNTMPTIGFEKVLENIKDMGGDSHVITATNMPVWCEKADTNVTGKVCCIRSDDFGIGRFKKESLVQARQDIKEGLKVANKDKVIIKNKPMFEEVYEPVETETEL